MILKRSSLALLVILALGADTARAQNAVNFSYSVKADGLTSAGVYDASGSLVRVLWTMKQTPAGRGTAEWDGKDDLGNPAPPGKYGYKVVLNRSTYTNAGVIGNTADPPTTQGHVPTNFEDVAVDASGAVYTVHDWDEPHYDIIKWDAQTGRATANSGHPVGDLLKAIAVEPDGSYAYVSSYANINDRTKSRFSIWKVNLAASPARAEPFMVAGKHIDVYKDGASYPADAGADQSLMSMPLLSLAVGGDTLYCTDSLGGRVLAYDKASGGLKHAFPIKLPLAVAVGDAGQLWVGHERGKVSLLDAAGEVLSTPITDLTEVNAVKFANGKLYVSDRGAGNIRVYSVHGTEVTLDKTLGDKARPGDQAAGRFIHLHGLAVDGQGNLIVASNGYFFNDGRLAKFTPQFTPVWRQMGLEFQSVANYNPDDPDTLFSVMHHAYLLDKKTGQAKFLGSTYEDAGYRGGVGGIKPVTLNGNQFVYMANGDGMAVYRVIPPADKERGPTLRLASLVAGSSPLPNGTNASESWKPENYYLWTWNDERGDGQVRQSDAVIFQKPEDKNAMFQHSAMSADAKGNIWFAGADWGSGRVAGTVLVLPVAGFNKLGNPIYFWKDARVVVSHDQFQLGKPSPEGIAAADPLAPPLSAGPKSIGVGSDGSIYAYANSSDKRTPQSGGLHMGGNVLVRFQLDKDAKLLDPDVQLPTKPYAKLPVVPDLAKRKWMIVLPQNCVGLDVIPPGPTANDGVMIGGSPWRGGIHHYTRDGLLIGQFQSDEEKFGGKANKNNPSGLMDMYGALAVSRDPRDGLLDVFVEDDFNLRIIWYRVNDRDISTVTGEITLQ